MVIYLDGADWETMRRLHHVVQGFTTNPSLMRSAGIANYRDFAEGILSFTSKPISFEVFADDMDGMERQAREIASWGENVYVKIPVTNTKGESTGLLTRKLGRDGIKLNVTAIFTFEQIETVSRNLIYAPAILSIFCGRIADTGRDPVPFIEKALRVKSSHTQVLWASTREVYNVVQARQAGANIITMSPDLIRKIDLIGKDLAQYSLETVTQFYQDARGLTL